MHANAVDHHSNAYNGQKRQPLADRTLNSTSAPEEIAWCASKKHFRPVSEFCVKADGTRAKTCDSCKAKRNRNRQKIAEIARDEELPIMAWESFEESLRGAMSAPPPLNFRCRLPLEPSLPGQLPYTGNKKDWCDNMAKVIWRITDYRFM